MGVQQVLRDVVVIKVSPEKYKSARIYSQNISFSFLKNRFFTRFESMNGKKKSENNKIRDIYLYIYNTDRYRDIERERQTETETERETETGREKDRE